MTLDISGQIALVAEKWRVASSPEEYVAATRSLQDVLDLIHAHLQGLELARVLDSLTNRFPQRIINNLLWIVQWEQLNGEAVRSLYPQGGWPVDDYLVQIALGRESSRAGDFSQAGKCFLEAVRLRPNEPLSRHWLGLSLANQGHYRQADLWLDSVRRYHLGQAAVVCLDPQRLDAIVDNGGKSYEPENIDGTPASAPDFVVLLSMDGGYFKKYGRRMMLSLHRQNDKADWLVHVHIIHPDQACLDIADELRQEEVPLVLSWGNPELPEKRITGDEIIEHRTLYACTRLLLWPWALEKYNCPVWIVDCDMEAVRPLPPPDPSTDAGFIRFPPSLMPLYQEFFLSAGYIRPTDEGVRFAKAMASYIQHYLDQHLWVWSLDQVAIYCIAAWLEQKGAPLSFSPLPSAMIFTDNWSQVNAGPKSADDHRVIFVNQVGSSAVTNRRTKII